jgi:hypothetical protein
LSRSTSLRRRALKASSVRTTAAPVRRTYSAAPDAAQAFVDDRAGQCRVT